MDVKVPILLWLSIGSCILPLAAGLWFRDRLTAPLILLLIYAAIVFGVELSSMILIYFYKSRTLWLFQLFTLLEFVLLSSMFLLWHTSKTKKIVIGALITAFTITWLLVIRNADESTFDSLVVTVEAVLLVGMAVVSLITLALEYTGSLFGNSRFWISSGVLLYFTGNLIVFALGSQLLQERDAALNAWKFHAVLNVVAHVFYMTGYLCLGRFRK